MATTTTYLNDYCTSYVRPTKITIVRFTEGSVVVFTVVSS